MENLNKLVLIKNHYSIKYGIIITSYGDINNFKYYDILIHNKIYKMYDVNREIIQ